MSWRGLVYLILIAPLHYILMVAANTPATLLLSSDIFIQLASTLPVFAAGVWWGVPAILRGFGLITPTGSPHKLAMCALLIALSVTTLVLRFIFMGYLTFMEGLIISAALLIICHGILLRRFRSN